MDQKRILSAGLMVFFGAGTILKSLDYNLGTLSRMGPGYFPLLLGGTLVVLGLLALITPDTGRFPATDEEPGLLRSRLRSHLRPWLAVTVGMLTFVIVGGAGGLVPGTFSLVFISALGDRQNSIRNCFWLAAGVTAAAVVVFHYGLRMQFPLFVRVF